MERLTEAEILMIFVVAAVNIIHTTESKKGKKIKKSLVEELFILKVKIRSIKFAAGNEIKWSRRLQKLFENTRKNCVGTYEFNCACNHKINNKYDRESVYPWWLETTCNYSLSSHWSEIYRSTVYFDIFRLQQTNIPGFVPIIGDIFYSPFFISNKWPSI